MMRTMSPALFFFVLVANGLACATYLVFFLSQKKELRHTARILLVISGVLQSLYIFSRFIQSGYTPITTQHEAVVFFAWATTWAYLTFRWRYTVKNFGAFVSILIQILLVAAYFSSTSILPVPPVLKSYWLPVHAGTSLIAYSFFSLAFCGGLMYLLQERELKNKKFGYFFSRLPSLDSLDQLNSHCLAIGFIFLSVGIISGSLWLLQTTGKMWSWGLKESWSIIIWLIYLVQIHQRFTVGWRGQKAAVMATLGFVLIIATLVVVMIPHGGAPAYGK